MQSSRPSPTPPPQGSRPYNKEYFERDGYSSVSMCVYIYFFPSLVLRGTSRVWEGQRQRGDIAIKVVRDGKTEVPLEAPDNENARSLTIPLYGTSFYNLKSRIVILGGGTVWADFCCACDRQLKYSPQKAKE
eukprot:4229098-Amphidinium_carterae.1